MIASNKHYTVTTDSLQHASAHSTFFNAPGTAIIIIFSLSSITGYVLWHTFSSIVYLSLGIDSKLAAVVSSVVMI